jgi:hypothetical protein
MKVLLEFATLSLCADFEIQWINRVFWGLPDLKVRLFSLTPLPVLQVRLESLTKLNNPRLTYGRFSNSGTTTSAS